MPAEKSAGKKLSTSEIAEQLAQPFAEELGLKFWNVKFEKEGSIWFLRYFMYREDRPINIEDCEDFSRKVSAELDILDPIDESYYLEVASPGIECELEKPWHFDAKIGEVVQIKLVRPLEGRREYIGTLLKYEDKKITIAFPDEEEKQREFDLAQAAYVKLYVEV